MGHGAAGTPVAPRFDTEFGSHSVQLAVGTLPWETQLVRVGNIPDSQSRLHLPGCPPRCHSKGWPVSMLPGVSAPSPWPFPLWQVRSVNLECGLRAQPAQLSPPAEPCSLRALVGGSPCPSAAGSGWPVWGQPQLRAEQLLGQSCAPGCPRWVLLSTEMFVAGPETVLQDPFITWISENLLGQESTAGFLQPQRDSFCLYPLHH